MLKWEVEITCSDKEVDGEAVRVVSITSFSFDIPNPVLKDA